MKAKQDKYIDLNQFVHKNGKISWDDSIGIVAEFFYNGERHEVEILEKIKKDYFKIRVDDIVLENTHRDKIKKLMFSKLFYKPNYFYDIGDTVNNLVILEQCKIKKSSPNGTGLVNVKAYKVKCEKDGYEFISDEWNLRHGHGCPVCGKRSTIVGFNDVATTNPELKEFFVDINDMKKYPSTSKAKVKVKCPNCGYIKYMGVSELVKCGYVTCDKCSDNVSYPNKFAHELFSQLSNQYSYYEYEYSPNWANNYFYDNYIVLKNGDKMIVEMDGAFHYDSCRRDVKNIIQRNDLKKDMLCKEHDIKIIRIDCNYVKIQQRFSYIKENVIKSLSNYFDLSYVDWDKCNAYGLSNIMYDVIDFYNNNPKFGLDDIANHFNICMETIYHYLHVGEELGLCTYIRADPKRKKDSNPVAMYDMSNNLIGIFKSTKEIEETFPDKNFNHTSMWAYCRKEKPYKGYVFKYVTYEEYLSFDYNNNKQIV